MSTLRVILLLLPSVIMADGPLPGCSELQCDAGLTECGICLQAIDAAQCPEGWESDFKLHTCDSVAPGELCEADGECGTVEVDNCNGRDPDVNGWHHGRLLQGWHHEGSPRSDVYRRVPCTMPPSPPAPPPAPCGSCDAGAACGRCLQVVRPDECPKAWHVEYELKACNVAEKGEYCEGDGECGTSQGVNNCTRPPQDLSDPPRPRVIPSPPSPRLSLWALTRLIADTCVR